MTLDERDLIEPLESQWQIYPDYKDSGIEWLGDIPAHWQIVPLRWYISIRSGDFVSNTDVRETIDTDNPIPVVGGNGILGYTKEPNSFEATISIGRVGGLCGNVHYIYDPAWITDNALRLSVTRGFSTYFLAKLLDSMNLNRLAYSTAQPLITGDSVKSLKVPLPPLNEQKKISTFLDRETAQIDALIVKKEELIALLQEQRQAIISHSVTKGLNPDAPMKDSGIEWLGNIPAHWKSVRLRHLSTSIQTGPFGSQLHSDEYIENGIPVINPSHIGDGKITPQFNVTIDDDTANRLSRHRLREGDIVFARRGEMGRCGLVTHHEAGWICGTGSMILRPNLLEVYPPYLNTVLSLRGISEELELSSVGATMNNLNTQIVGEIAVPIPPIVEQIQIVETLTEETTLVDELISMNGKTINKLQEYRTALISAAVTGKIDVRGEM